MKRAIITGLLVIGAACLILGCSKKEGAEKQDKANTEASGESEDEEENEKEPNEERTAQKRMRRRKMQSRTRLRQRPGRRSSEPSLPMPIRSCSPIIQVKRSQGLR